MINKKRVFTRLTALMLCLCLVGTALPLVQAAEANLGLKQIFPLILNKGFQIGDSYLLYSTMESAGAGLQPIRPGEEFIVMDFAGQELFRTDEYCLTAIAGAPYVWAYIMEISEPGMPPSRMDFGILNLQGEVVIPVAYNSVNPVRGGFTLTVGNPEATGIGDIFLYGFANEDGEIVYEPRYASATEINFAERDLFYGKMDGIWHTVEARTGEILYSFDPEIEQMRGITFPGFVDEYPWMRASKAGLWGIMDFEGNVLLPFEYDQVKTFSEGLIWVKQDGLWGLVDAEFNVVLPPTYEMINRMDTVQMWSDFSQGSAVIQNAEGQFGIVDRQGQLVVDFGVYDEIGQRDIIYRARPIGVRNGDFWQFVDSAGQLISETTYKYVMPFSMDRAFVCTVDGDWLLLDGSGETVVELPFSLDSYIRIVPTPGPDGSMTMETMAVPLSYAEEVLGLYTGEQSILIDRYANILAKGFEGITVQSSLYPLLPLSHDNMLGLWEVVELAPGEECIIVEPDVAGTEEPGSVPGTELPEAPVVIAMITGKVTRGNYTYAEMPVLPAIVNDRTMMPFAYLVELLLDGEASCDEAEQTLTAVIGDTAVVFEIGNTVYLAGVETCDLGVAPYLSGETAMVPLRAFAQCFADLLWDGNTQEITLVP
ncbi:MAG: WG repeat-containing protein [Symbiobacteriaceae bacterium]|nr:WG repeat-containing protein [Symbiobacteriaceae bacterium]